MVIVLSPVLIMALVGSLCFFLIEVFYRGKMLGGVCWVMFWFNHWHCTCLTNRHREKLGTRGGLRTWAGRATWLYMMRTQPAYLVGIVLAAIVWFCAHKLVLGLHLDR